MLKRSGRHMTCGGLEGRHCQKAPSVGGRSIRTRSILVHPIQSQKASAHPVNHAGSDGLQCPRLRSGQGGLEPTSFADQRRWWYHFTPSFQGSLWYKRVNSLSLTSRVVRVWIVFTYSWPCFILASLQHHCPTTELWVWFLHDGCCSTFETHLRHWSNSERMVSSCGHGIKASALTFTRIQGDNNRSPFPGHTLNALTCRSKSPGTWMPHSQLPDYRGGNLMSMRPRRNQKALRRMLQSVWFGSLVCPIHHNDWGTSFCKASMRKKIRPVKVKLW